jgi:hypothetical protein
MDDDKNHGNKYLAYYKEMKAYKQPLKRVHNQALLLDSL